MTLHKFWAVVGTVLAVLAPVLVVFAAPPAQAQTYSVLYSFHGKHGQYPYGNLIQGKLGALYGTTQAGGSYKQGTVFELRANGKEKVLYSFTGGADGGQPAPGVVRDAAGNLYGTTCCYGSYGRGMVFKLDQAGAETVLYSFTGGTDGAFPDAGVVRDSAGNLYGTTYGGGAYGQGTVFKLDQTGAETVLYSFTGGRDGAFPDAAVVRDSAGNLYSTTYEGGTYGQGTVFKLKTDGKEKVLYSFTGGTDAEYPHAGVVRDSAGNLYGTTSYGGTYEQGTVFKLDKTGAETVLYSFTGGTDGASPAAGVVRDSAGNLYGTTSYGGTYGYGVVFKLDTSGAETVLYSFTGGGDGGVPAAGLVRDSAGNLYGTAFYGGTHGQGTVFKITPQ